MADTIGSERVPARTPGRAAVAAYRLIDLLDRIWRRVQRDLDKRAVARAARR